MRLEKQEREPLEWSLLTPRGLALVYIAQHPGCTRRELAGALDMTERNATKILSDLSSAGAVRRSNGDGRRFHYDVNLSAALDVQEGRFTLRRLLSGMAS